MKAALLALLLATAPADAATGRVGSIDGIAIIDRLDVGDLPAGAIQHF